MKKIYKNISIILSILILILDIWLWFEIKSNFEINYSDQYRAASVLLIALLEFGNFIWGVLLIPIIWIEYFLINLLYKIYNKLDGVKKYILLVIIAFITILLMIFFIKIFFVYCWWCFQFFNS